MSTKGPDDDDPMRDATVVRPRTPAAPVIPQPPPAASAARAPVSRSAAATPPPAIDEFFGSGLNPLLQAASALLLLAVQLRNSVSQPDAANLRAQVVVQIRQFESQAQAASVPPQTVTAARYVLCTMLDEAVLNTPWGERSGWAAKTLLVVFHGETYGGEKFFQILERLCADFSRHIDLIELMYVCVALGFGGRYQVEPGGVAKLADIQEELYRRLKAQRATAVAELSPHWKGIEDRRNPLIRYVPLWVIAAAAACVLLGTFLFLYSNLNTRSSPISALLAKVGLETATPPAQAQLNQIPAASTQPAVPRKTLKQLLAPQEQAGALEVIEQKNGRELVRINAAAMFASGGVEVSSRQIPLLHTITQALNRVAGRVIVVGHTDDQPIHSLKYKDNYELSAVRADSVKKILSQGIDNAGRLESSGAGASQPIALPPNLPANRARNRRVELIFIPEG